MIDEVEAILIAEFETGPRHAKIVAGRIRAAIRNAKLGSRPLEKIVWGDWVFDCESRVLTAPGINVQFTEMESKVVASLLSAKGSFIKLMRIVPNKPDSWVAKVKKQIPDQRFIINKYGGLYAAVPFVNLEQKKAIA